MPSTLHARALSGAKLDRLVNRRFRLSREAGIMCSRQAILGDTLNRPGPRIASTLHHQSVVLSEDNIVSHKLYGKTAIFVRKRQCAYCSRGSERKFVS